MQMIKALRNQNIFDEKVLASMANVKRHLFLESAFNEWAYRDVAFSIDADQTISQPSTVALQTTLLEVKKGHKVLEIGTGSGYQACILSYLGAKVYTIERQKILFDKTNKLLIELGYAQIRTLLGDGHIGAERFAPFDRIIVTCGATQIPQPLIDQLAIGGIIVIPLGEGEVKNMVKIRKESATKFVSTRHGHCSFVPFLSGVNNQKNDKNKGKKVSL
jgi:protein-L-isoaspartate(D-aspartate) O-methyltransferase